MTNAMDRSASIRGLYGAVVWASVAASCTGVIGESGTGSTAAAPSGADDPSRSQSQPGVPFVPGPSGLRRLTRTQFQASMRDLLGPLTLQATEGDVRQQGLAQVGASHSVPSAQGVEGFESAVRDALGQVFADQKRRDVLIGCSPGAANDDACALAFLSGFARRAWRGTPAKSDLGGYVALAGQVSKDQNDFYAGVQAAASGILQSPNFLYRVELGEPLAGKPGWLRYTSLEMATRLSYLVWNTTPDDALLAAGEASDLLDPAKLAQQASRLASSPRAQAGLDNFVNELFLLDGLQTMGKDPQRYRQLGPTLREAMATEIGMLFKDVAYTRKVDLLEIFDSPRTFANKELAKVYGLKVDGESFVSVTPPNRVGVLGTAGVLSLLSGQSITIPTRRGKFIREALLCQTIPAPPDKVPALPAPMRGLTRRQQLDRHRTDPGCAGCHALMDPLGYGLENFDPLGIYRSVDSGVIIDPAGALDGAPFSNAKELGLRIREHPATAGCLVRTMYRYATGRAESDAEAPILDELTRGFRESGHRLETLLRDMVLSDGFRFASAPGVQEMSGQM